VTDDRDEATALATRLEAANLDRRDQTKTAVAEARAALAGDAAGAGDASGAGDAPAAVVVRGAWPVGIVGLVAGRLAEELARPAVVGADLGAIVRASCRSDGTVNLAAALEACSDLLERHGGHAGAAGFEIVTDRWEAFRERFLTIAAASPRADPRPVLRVDLVVPALDVDYALHRELAALAPCGPGNPDPLVAIRGLTVVRARVAGGGHSQVTLRRDRDVLDGIAFDWPELAGVVAEGDRIDVVGRLMSRTFAGLETLQVEIRDAAPADRVDREAGSPVMDTRPSGIPA
jgi:single-stranded-DNA-specific exonuclease